MRRFSIGLVLVVALLLMLTAIAASAVPDGFCDGDRVHPQCPTTTTPTPTTTPESSPLQACTADVLDDVGDGSIGRVGLECLWTPADNGALVGTITVEPSSPISQLVVFVRDSSPGDICVLKQLGKVDSPYVASFNLFYPVLSEDFDPPYEPYNYAPYVDKTYWTWNAPNWCYPQDPIVGMREDLNGEPLHLNVGFLAKKNTTVTVSLNPPQKEDPPAP